MKYIEPTANEVRDILHSFDLTGAKAAEQTGIVNKQGQPKSRTFRRFTAVGEGNVEMPYAVLFTLVMKNTGRVVSMHDWRDVLYQEQVLQKRRCSN